MSEFFKTQIIIILLAIYGVFYAEYPYYLLCCAGLLMVIYTLESLLEESNMGLIMLKIFLMALCCTLSHGFLLFLLFSQVGYRKTNLFLSPVLFLIFQVVSGRNTIYNEFALILVKMIILLCLSFMIWYMEKMIFHYIDYRERVSLSMVKLAMNEMAERKLNQELVIKNMIIERNTRLEERENISRNIHNSVGHSITAAIMALEAAELLWQVDSDRAIEKVRTANERIHLSLDSIRRAVRILDEDTVGISIDDLIMELKEMIENFMMDTDIRISMDRNVFNDDLMVSHEDAEFLTGAVEELLTNGVKHGKADKFIVRLVTDSSHLKITVLDNGQSDFCEKNSVSRIDDGFGIKKIIQYVQNHGGSTIFKNENGFRAEITIRIGNPTTKEF